MIFHDNDGPLLEGKESQGVYVLDKIFPLSAIALPLVSAPIPNNPIPQQSTPTLMPHRRFAHLGADSLAGISACTDTPMSGRINAKDCHSCALTKQTGHANKIEEPADAPLGRVHFDIAGPFHKGLENEVYFLIVRDSFSIMTWVYGLKRKSDVPAVMVSWRIEAEHTCQRKVMSVRTDNEPELLKATRSWAQRFGTKAQPTTCHTFSQNGPAERAIRAVMKIMRSSLKESGFSKAFWLWAAKTGSYVSNLKPMSSPVDCRKHLTFRSINRFSANCSPHPPTGLSSLHLHAEKKSPSAVSTDEQTC